MRAARDIPWNTHRLLSRAYGPPMKYKSGGLWGWTSAIIHQIVVYIYDETHPGCPGLLFSNTSSFPVRRMLCSSYAVAFVEVIYSDGRLEDILLVRVFSFLSDCSR